MGFNKIGYCFQGAFKASHVMLVAFGLIRELAFQLEKQCFIDKSRADIHSPYLTPDNILI
jgi:hypothetical protein